MSVLVWFPYDVEQWEKRTADLTLEEEGALTRLCRMAWAEEIPCTLPESATRLERILGARWQRLRHVLAANFTPDSAHPGRLVCTWLLALYDEQHGKYSKRVERNNRYRRRQKGEETDTTPATSPESSPATSQETHVETTSETQGETSQPSRAESKELRRASPGILKNPGLEAPAPSGAFALGEARAAGAGEEATNVLHGEYYQRLRARAQTWLERHPDEAAQLEEDTKRELALPEGRKLTGWQQQFLTDRIADVIRERQGWPDAETWIAEQVRERLNEIPITNGHHA